jgi:hypothetical protein
MSEVTWTVTQPSGEVMTSKPVVKLPNYIEVKIAKTTDDNTKAFFEKFNNMRNKLIEHGLMEQK